MTLASTRASARTAGSSLLGTVTSTANAVTGVVTTLADSVDILHNYVNRHKVMQSDKNLVELKTYRSKLIEDTADELAERRKVARQKLKDPVYAELHKAAFDEIAALFNSETAQA
jgi:hypothetical protein